MGKDRIGIFGGTFNPIHNGHLILAQNALEFCDLSKVYFVPSGCSYFKDQSLIMPKTDRLNMVRLCTEDNNAFEVSNIETDKPGNSYTCETLSDFSKMFPHSELYYIIGADTLFSIESWKDPEVIFSLATIIAAPRDFRSIESLNSKIDELKEKFNANIILLNSANLEISSSDIRRRIKSGLSVRYYLQNKVNDYIESEGLYK